MHAREPVRGTQISMGTILDSNIRQALFAQKLVMFTEVVFWLAHGLERNYAINFGIPGSNAITWTDALRDQLVEEWREIVQRYGVEPGTVAVAALHALPVEHLLSHSQRSEIFLNFLIYLAKQHGGTIPDTACTTPQMKRLYQLLQDQDFSVIRRFNECLRRPAGAFLHVGANDANSPDDQSYIGIYQNADWKKVLVEPDPRALTALRQNVKGMPAVEIIEAVISDTTAMKTLTLYESTRLSTLEPQIPTPTASTPEGHEINVNALDGPSLFEAGNLTHVDVFVCDTEGHDRIVLEQVLRCTTPGAIALEFANLAAEDRIAVIEMLVSRGFDWCREPFTLDIIAVHHQAKKERPSA